MKNSNRNRLYWMTWINLISLFTVLILEIIGMFVELPILVYSEGDAAGIAEFSGNYLDHITKAFIAATLVLTFAFGLLNFHHSDVKMRKKAFSFIIGGNFLVMGLGFLFLLSWGATLIDFALVGELSEITWWSYVRLEIVLAFLNLHTFSIWKQKTQIIPHLINDNSKIANNT